MKTLRVRKSHELRKCATPGCGETFVGGRVDKRHCNERCRRRHTRIRRNETKERYVTRIIDDVEFCRREGMLGPMRQYIIGLAEEEGWL